MTILVQYFYLSNIFYLFYKPTTVPSFLFSQSPHCSLFNTKWSILIDVQTIQSTEVEGVSIWENLEYEHFNGVITPSPLKTLFSSIIRRKSLVLDCRHLGIPVACCQNSENSCCENNNRKCRYHWCPPFTGSCGTVNEWLCTGSRNSFLAGEANTVFGLRCCSVTECLLHPQMRPCVQSPALGAGRGRHEV